MKIKTLLIILMTMATTMLPWGVKAQNVSVWDGTSAILTQGSGTEADPYLIQNAQNLAWISEMVNNGVTTYSGVYFKLTIDLDMNNIAWVPIGNSETNCFCGKFDGDNHFIDSISITGNYTYKGLFGIAGTGFSCENIGVNTNVSSSGNYSGGIVGWILGSNIVIKHCYNTGTLKGQIVGGIVGYNNAGDNSLIISCYNNGTITASKSISSTHDVTASSYAGGIIGYNNKTMNIYNCYNIDTISSSSSSSSNGSNCSDEAYAYAYSGGIVGCNSNKTMNINNCYNTGTISSSSSSNSYCSASSDSYSYSGGIIGYSSNSSSSLNLFKCYNNANIVSTAHTVGNGSGGTRKAYSGGIVGYGGTQIVNCYNRSWVTANAHYSSNNTTNGTQQAGGICGTAATTIKNCYNIAGLTGGTRGGIRGEASGTVTNCYYLETCGGTVSGGTPKTAAAMKSPSFPIMLNADSMVYVMDITPNVNDGYPIFGTTICEVFTHNASNVKFTTATLNGAYSQAEYWPGGTADVVGFEYKESSSSSYTTVYANVDSLVSYALSGLQSGTAYDYRFFIQKNGVSYYGRNKTFTTQACDLQVAITKSVTEICVGESASFTVSASSSYSNLFTYEWNNGSTNTSINVSDANTYTVTVQDTNGCAATATASVEVHPLPQGVISGNTSLCPGESSTLTASGANSYHWSTGATTPVITVNNSGTYACTFTNSYGCSSTESVTVSIFAAPIITGNSSFCEGSNTTLTATGGSSYAWSTGATSASINVNTAGNYTVIATASNGCSASASVTVVQNQPTPVTITGNTIICNEIGTSLTVTQGASYMWSTGATSQSVSINTPGVYSVSVTNTYGCVSTASQTVSMMEQAVISGNTHICEGQSTSLSVNGTGNYLWNTNANTSSIDVTNPGLYSVTVSLSNGCTSSASVNVIVASLPTPTISGNTTLCQGENTTLTANGGSSYIWSNASTQNNITVYQSGIYTVTATNAEGCTASTSTTVIVNPLPNVSITGNSSFCQGNNTTLTANGANSYVWNNNSTDATLNVSSAGTYTVTGTDNNGCSNTASKTVSVNPTYTIPLAHSICEGEGYNFYGQNLTTAGTYTHTLQTVDGCDSVLSLTLNIKPLPTPTITGNTTLCEGESTTLTATGGTSYVWSNASTQNNITVSQSGIYTVTATNAEGCTASTSTTVIVNPLPNVSITGDNSFCQGSNTTLTANGANSYIWNNSSTDASLTVSSAGTYTVTGTDNNGCSNTASKTVSLNPTYTIPLTHSICEGENYNFYGQNLTTAGTYTHTLQTIDGCDSILSLTLSIKALPTTSITGNTTLCEGESTTLTATGGNSYLWSNGSTNNNINISQSGIYSVIATNLEGCSASANVTVSVNPLPNVSINGNTTLCQGSNTTLTANGADSYSWSTGENTASINVSAFGIYTVTGTSAAGCSNTATATVIVSQVPVITITGNTELCEGETTTLTATGGSSYLWSNGTTDANISVNIAGTYQVIGYNDAGCNTMAETSVHVWQPATSEFTITTTEDCYEWNGQSYCQSGDYTQTLQTVHGCDSVVTLHLTITVGIDDYNLANSMTFYPNPTSDLVNVQLTMNNEQLEEIGIQVFDVYGRLLEVVNMADARGASLQTAQIDLSRYAQGVYFVKAVSEGKVIAVRKMVKR